MKDKQFIIGEIQRTAVIHGGEPLGQRAFQAETGIGEYDWKGVHWARWGDALMDAGFKLLEWNPALNEEDILRGLAGLVRKYGRYPVKAEIQIESRNNASVPVPNTLWRRWGGRADTIQKLREYCSTNNDEYADVLAALAEEPIETEPASSSDEEAVVSKKERPAGYVYLARSGKLFKIGQTANRWRRMSQLDRQTVEGIDELIHTISAYDDALGIEAYWHRRFREKHVRNEIFDLSAEDIRAFKKRKWM
jgi:hypothetical protein